MGEHICFRRNERLATVNPYWRGNPMVRGRFFNRQHRFRPGMGSVLKWRLSPNPQRKEKKTVKWDPKVCYLRSLDAVVGDSLIWLGHNSFFLQLAGKRIMFDPVFGNIPFVKRQSEFPANPDIFTEIDYLLISHDHFDHLDKQSITRLLNNNPQMKLFCGLGTGELSCRHSIGANAPYVMEGSDCGELSCCRGMVFLSIIAETQGILPILGKSRICSELRTMPCWVSVHINPVGSCVPIIFLLMNH